MKKFILIVFLFSVVFTQENLDEIVARKSRQAVNTFYPGDDSSPAYHFQPMMMAYRDTAYNTETWRMTSTANLRNWVCEEYGQPTCWSADGKRLFFASDMATAAYSKTTSSELYYLSRADGTQLRPAEDGPCRSASHRIGLNWSMIEPDVFFQYGNDYVGEFDAYGITEQYLYRTTVYDDSVVNQEWVDFGDTGDRNIQKTISPDGKKAVVMGWSKDSPMYICTLYPSGVLEESWDLDDSERQWPSYWGPEGEPEASDFHNTHLVGNYDVGYWLFGNVSDASHGWWKMRLTGSGTDGGPQHVDDTTPPFSWYPDGEIQPANMMYNDGNDPWCIDEDAETDCGEYWSHPGFYRDGFLCVFSNTEASPIAPGIYDSQNRVWATASYDEDYGIQHNSWNGFTDYTAHWSGISDAIIWIGKYDDSGNEILLNSNHEEGDADDDGVNQSPDGTKLMWGSSFLNNSEGEEYNDIFQTVAYYPFPPDVSSVTATGGTVTVTVSWKLESSNPRSYTTRGWPDPDSDAPPPPREIEYFRLWRSTDKSTWVKDDTTTYSIFSRFNFPDGNTWDGDSTWTITDAVDDGTYYYAVTSVEWSGLESHCLSDIFSITVSSGSGTGAEDTAYPAKSTLDTTRISSFYNSYSDSSYVKYVNIYAEDGSSPSISQTNLILSIPVKYDAHDITADDDTLEYVDWLGNTDGSTEYVAAYVDYQGNISTAVSGVTYGHQSSPATEVGQYLVTVPIAASQEDAPADETPPTASGDLTTNGYDSMDVAITSISADCDTLKLYYPIAATLFKTYLLTANWDSTVAASGTDSLYYWAIDDSSNITTKTLMDVATVPNEPTASPVGGIFSGDGKITTGTGEIK